MDVLNRLKYLKNYAKDKNRHIKHNFGGFNEECVDGMQFIPQSYHDSLKRCSICKLKYDPRDLVEELCKFCTSK